MALPLRKTISIAVLTAAITLVCMLALGVRQVQLARQHEVVAAQTEKIVFQFAIIREHLQELLLNGEYGRMAGIANDLEELNANLVQLFTRKEIAEEYQLSLINTVDVPGLILQVRKIGEPAVTPEALRQLNDDMRTAGERLLLFDRLVVNSTKVRLIDFQNIVIGSLAVVLSLLVAVLLWLRRHLVEPVAQLGTAALTALEEGGELLLPESIKGSRETNLLQEVVRELFSVKRQFEEETVEEQQLAAALKRASLAMAAATDKKQMFRDVCRSLLLNPEYCLVWIGEVDATGTDIEPVSADGSTTMSRKECEACLAVLLTDAEEKGVAHNPALQAVKRRETVVARDILAEIPMGLLKETPLAHGKAACAALPVIWQETLYGVISIYAASNEAFSEQELGFLETFAAVLGCATTALATQGRLAVSQERLRQLFAELGAVLIALDNGGRVVSVNESGAALSDSPASELVGRQWQQVLRLKAGEYVDREPSPELLEELSGCRRPLSMAIQGRNREHAVSCQVIKEANGFLPAGYWCVAFPVGQEGWLRQGGEQLRTSRLAVLGEVATGVAHEVSDLSNGVINYAQVLADEASQDASQSGLLHNIITAGEHIATLVGKLVFYGEEGQPEEYLPLLNVLKDAVMLSGCHMRHDGIQLEVEVPEHLPALPVNAHQLQQVFVTVCDNARRSLNLRYPGRHQNKKFRIEGFMVSAAGQDLLRLVFTDHGLGLDAGQFDKGGKALGEADLAALGFEQSRKIVAQHGGTMTVTSVGGEHTTVTVDFPL